MTFLARVLLVIFVTVVTFGYLGFRLIQYVTVLEGSHQINMGDNT